jgi:hypothetical protein
MHIIITGATGLIGSAALDIALNDPEVTKISILSRSHVPQAWAQPKAEAIYVPDFGNYDPELVRKLEDAKGIIWCLGETRHGKISTEYVSLPGFELDGLFLWFANIHGRDLDRINVQYPLYAAKTFAAGKKSFNFVFISSMSKSSVRQMNQLLTSRIVLGIEKQLHEDVVDKGKAEEGLIKLHKEMPNLKPYSLRLCAMDYRGHKAVLDNIKYPRPWWKVLASWVIPMVKWYSALLNCDSPDFGFLMTELAKGDGEPIEEEYVLEDGRFVLAPAFNPLVAKLRAQKGQVEDAKTK